MLYVFLTHLMQISYYHSLRAMIAIEIVVMGSFSVQNGLEEFQAPVFKILLSTTSDFFLIRKADSEEIVANAEFVPVGWVNNINNVYLIRNIYKLKTMCLARNRSEP